MTCKHDGFQSGQSRYQPAEGVLRYVMVCDECGSEISDMASETYRPAFDPAGNDPFLADAA